MPLGIAAAQSESDRPSTHVLISSNEFGTAVPVSFHTPANPSAMILGTQTILNQIASLRFTP